MRILFIFSLFFGACIANEPKLSPAQKLADVPRDRPIAVRTATQDTLCYIPTFSLGAEQKSYIGLLNCAVQGALKARYDVFGRIGFYINNTWLCLTAPYSVAVQGRDKDYLYLSPCVINTRLQQWKIKDGKFYSHDEFYTIKDDGSYLYAAHKLNGDLREHKLDASMTEWANTIAKPGNLSLITAISWDLEYKEGRETYFLYNNASQKNTTPLFYNLVSGHIAQYDALSGTLYCMYSSTGKQEWDWVHWGLCSDDLPPKDNKAFFKPILLSDSAVAFEDQDGNVLRVTRYGTHWGVPYTANKSFLSKDTGNSPTSSFNITHSLNDWLRFINANIGENLPSCPAKGYANADLTYSVIAPHKLDLSPELLTQNPLLPPDFTLSTAWIDRFYAIATTSNDEALPVGVCGACLLQAFQVIAELIHDPHTPLSSGGYFFDTGYHQNPFVSFRARNSLLHDTLRDIIAYYNYNVRTESDLFRRAVDRTQASAVSLLPQYNWNLWGTATNQAGIDALLDRVLNAPVGSVFIFTLGRFDDQTRRLSGHALAALRLRDGIVAIPANTPNLARSSFDRRLTPSRTRDDLRTNLTRFGSRFLQLAAFGVIEARGFYFNPFSALVSVRDCSGEGEDRRGNGLLPLPELINQCISGRCEW